MSSPCIREASQVCFHGCCTIPLLSLPEPHKTSLKSRSTTAVNRSNFVTKTTSAFFPNTQFTNHESLPSLNEAFTQFIQTYEEYSESDRVDQIRAEEYYHLSLSSHVCLDYIGTGLFSYSQFQKQHSSTISIASSSSPPPILPPPQNSDVPFFSISYKTVNLKLQLQHGGQESELQSAIKKRIMGFLKVSENDYGMVFTANRTSAFKLVAESYPFQSSRKLLTVYDYESEAVGAMIDGSEKRGAKAMAAEFTWPRLRIHTAKLKKMIISKRKKKKRGIFVFPLHSRMSGARYSHLWIRLAQENGWHVLLDACALGPKDMDSFGLSLFRPDFLICSFYKVFGENPTGFACLFVKKSTVSILENSTGTGIVSIVPAKKLFRQPDESSGTDTELEHTAKFGAQEDDGGTSSSFSGPISTAHSERSEQMESSQLHKTEVGKKQKGPDTSERVESEPTSTKITKRGSLKIECRGLDHVDSLGLRQISNRARYLINWLVNALLKLQHPNAEKGSPLVQIYGPRIKFDRGPALAFNVFDWRGERVEPILVQKLADRSNISLSYGFLHQIWFSDKYEEEKERVIERRTRDGEGKTGNKRKDKAKAEHGLTVVTAAIGFLANFEDVYKLWAFVAQFLDADCVEKERWRYTALNQKTVEV